MCNFELGKMEINNENKTLKEFGLMQTEWIRLPINCLTSDLPVLMIGAPVTGFGNSEYLAIVRQIVQSLLIGLDTSSANFEIKKMDSGKPFIFLDNGKAIPISISHTDASVLVAMRSSGEVGVDVENINRMISEGLIQRIRNEKDVLLSDIDTLRLWTIKESFLKMTGSGLRTNMNKVCIREVGTHFFEAEHENVSASVVSFEYNGKWISVCWNSSN